MRHFRIWVAAGTCLVIGGALLGFTPFTEYWRSKHVPHVSASPFIGTAAALPETVKPTIEGRPVRIEIPALSIDLPVVDGHYNTTRRSWTLSNDKVHYAVMTALANDKAGNTFVYGHNKVGVFRTLSRIKLEDKAIITTDNGHRFTYSFNGALETVPTDDALFHYQGEPILTVQTCSGAWYQNRQLFTFSLESVE
jgi:LPXTG-site transpeptidase (sortase) family protein